jgi:hypothetical protein
MLQVAQFDTCRFGEFGVQAKYLDRKGDFVDHALAGSVPTAKQFQVFWGIVAAVAINVVHRFFGKQVASERFGHDVPVFHHSVFLAGDKRWHGNPDVSMALDVPAEITPIEFVEGSVFLRFNFAFLAAVFLLLVNAASWFTVPMFNFATLFAHKFVSFVSVFSASQGRTRVGTVKRVFSEFLLICSQVRLHHGERFAALFAVKRVQGFTCGRQFLAETMPGSTGQATVFAALFCFAGIAIERVAAVRTRHLDRHGFSSPLCGSGGSIAMSLGVVQ